MKNKEPVTVEDARNIVAEACKADRGNVERIYYMVSGMMLNASTKRK